MRTAFARYSSARRPKPSVAGGCRGPVQDLIGNVSIELFAEPLKYAMLAQEQMTIIGQLVIIAHRVVSLDVRSFTAEDVSFRIVHRRVRFPTEGNDRLFSVRLRLDVEK